MQNHTFIVNPVNEITDKLDNFFDHVFLKNPFSHRPAQKTEPVIFKQKGDGPKTIRLIGLKEIGCIFTGTNHFEEAVNQMDQKGFVPAIFPYLLGLGVEHPTAINRVITLDEVNAFQGRQPGGDLYRSRTLYIRKLPSDQKLDLWMIPEKQIWNPAVRIAVISK